MSFEETQEGNEIWTCEECGYSVLLLGVGGDVACCPKCITKELLENEL